MKAASWALVPLLCICRWTHRSGAWVLTTRHERCQAAHPGDGR